MASKRSSWWKNGRQRLTPRARLRERGVHVETISTAKAGIAKFGESHRRELDGEGIRWFNVYPVATDTPMTVTSSASLPLGYAENVAEEEYKAIVDG